MLAAANSVYGRWDDTKGAENIDFMPTILSRFDMIFIVKDEHDEAKDTVSAFFVFMQNLGNKNKNNFNWFFETMISFVDTVR